MEYVVEVGLHLKLFRDRNDLTVDYFRYPLPGDSQPIHYFVVDPVMVNAPLPSVRNSLHENGVLTWHQCLATTINPRLIAPSYESVRKLRWTDFGANRLLGWVGLEDKNSFSVEGRPFLDSKEMDYGWQVYEIEIDPADIAFPGSYNEAGEWALKTPQGERIVSNFGNPGDFPLSGDLNGDGQTDLVLYQPASHRFQVDQDFDGSPDLDFELVTMQAEDIPLLGDWDGDGADTPGYFRPSELKLAFHQKQSLPNRRDSPLNSCRLGDLPAGGRLGW